MNWSNEKAAKAADRKSPSQNGEMCIFVKLSPTEGVKFFPTPEMRDKAKELQENAFCFDCGPNVGDSCEMPFLKSWPLPGSWGHAPETVYGYVTEIATDIGKVPENERLALRDRMDDLGLPCKDIHMGNCGRIGDRVVCIDFDPVYYGDLMWSELKAYQKLVDEDESI